MCLVFRALAKTHGSTGKPKLRQISLDWIREETKGQATGNQGTVGQTAREKARAFLRSGEDFGWSATNLSREIRTQVVDLLAAYDARIRIVYVEASRDLLFAQNRKRRERNAALPTAAIERNDGSLGSAGSKRGSRGSSGGSMAIYRFCEVSRQRPKRAIDPGCSRLSELSNRHSAWLPARIRD